jgi:hypothetical protein
MKLRGLFPNFLIQVSVTRFIYIPTIGPSILQQRLILGVLYKNCSQINECGNWELGRTVSFLGINKYDLLYSVYAV